jgi:hypothetical protein
MEDHDYAHELAFESEHHIGDQLAGKRVLSSLTIAGTLRNG